MAGKNLAEAVFRGAVERARLSKDSAVAVAVSGGCDSMALLWLARQAFSDVVGLTVDHKVRADSSEEAVKVGELVRGVGAHHHILRVEWEGDMPTTSKLQALARGKRYGALLKYCDSAGLATLMTAHHLDDQIETLVYRLSMGSGIDGLAGMQELTQRVAYPGIQLLHPLLSLRKEQLLALCKGAGLEWVEDPSNQVQFCSRNRIRHQLSSDPELSEGLCHLHTTLTLTAQALRTKLNEIVDLLAVVDTKYGFVTLQKEPLLSLPPPLLRRLLGVVVQYMSAEVIPLRYSSLTGLVSALAALNSTTTIRKCCVFPVGEGVIGISALPDHTPVPIKVGGQITWADRWEVKLFPVNRAEASRHQYFVRPFTVEDSGVVKHRRRKQNMPPLRARLALPVLTDETGAVKAIPHFNYTSRKCPVSVSVKHKPLIPFHYLINKTYHS